MSTTTAYGYKVPAAGDLASVWMPNEEDNWTRISGHAHDGVDSKLLVPTAITKFTTVIASADWGSPTAGEYTQTITVPAGITELNSYNIFVYITSTGERIFPYIIRQSATTYTITVNDNSLALTVTYH